jgi:mRNA-degrading endonuclease YafQ of YafQ-DinJ toxin-antitoxin module
MAVKIIQSSAFARAYKRLHNNQKDAVDQAVARIVDNPELCDAKKGDLLGVFVYKFNCVNQQFLLAFEYDPQTRALLLVGTHENLYRDLKH